MKNVTTLGASAAARTGGYVLPISDYDSGRGVEMRTTFETHLGLFHVLADGTVLLRVNQDAIMHSPPGPMADEAHIEMTHEQAMEIARTLMKLSHAADERQKLLDGRSGYSFSREEERWWVSHDDDAMALRTLKTKPVKSDPRAQRLDFDTKTTTSIPYDRAGRRKCASCQAVLCGVIYVEDRAVKARLKRPTWGHRPQWSTCEFCVTCVEAPKRTGLRGVKSANA